MPSDWWSRKFQEIGAAPPPAAPVYQQPVVPQQQPTSPPQASQGRFSQSGAGSGHGTYQDILNGNIDGYSPDPKKYENLRDTSVPSHCPACDSPNYFSRSRALRSGGRAPAPHCFECGYNGESVYSQEAAPIDSKTPVNAARGQTRSHLDYSAPIARVT